MNELETFEVTKLPNIKAATLVTVSSRGPTPAFRATSPEMTVESEKELKS